MMKAVRLLMAGAMAGYIWNELAPGRAAGIVLSVCSLGAAALLPGIVKGIPRLLGLLFTTAGVVMYARHGTAWQEAINGFGRMLNVITLLTIVPIVSLPIELGGYARRIQTVIRSNIRHTGPLYIVTSLLSFVLSAFMSLATLPMVYRVIRPSVDLYPVEHKERFMSRAITHGYSMPFLWTPVAPIVGVVVEMTGVSWGRMLPLVIPFSLLGLVLDCGMGLAIAGRHRRRMAAPVLSVPASGFRSADIQRASGLKNGVWLRGIGAGDGPAVSAGELRTAHSRPKQPWSSDAEDPDAAASIVAAAEASENPSSPDLSSPQRGRNPFQILLAMAVFGLSLPLLQAVTGLGFLLLVSLFTIPFALMWAVFISEGRMFVVNIRELLPMQLLRMKDQFLVLLCAGFMISAIENTGAGLTVNAGISLLGGLVGEHLFLALIPMIPLALSMAGVHPVVGTALTAGALNPALLHVPVELTAMAMLVGASCSYMLGPYNATAGLMSSLSGETPQRISNWNAPFTAVFLLTAMVFLYVSSM
ncbi:hypothetical protein [Paenibacillus apii]|uniref:hypothetical protein n=1 Tax=Paenibacillus apii TaxID=1850370 RepID=UPI00143C9880|nr:hypothetical protein [Paenibacillus apii]NJJ39640.1 hypothetical protein [Paenibacillus apii]